MDSDGNSAFNAIHIAGDIVGVDAWPGTPFTDDLVALTEGAVVQVPAGAIRTAAVEDATIALAVADFLAAENGFLREALFAVGRQPSMARLCTFFLQIHQRLVAAGQIEAASRRFKLPLTQEELATATGLTTVHVNRTLKLLREQGWLEFRGSMVNLMNLPAIEAQAHGEQV